MHQKSNSSRVNWKNTLILINPTGEFVKGGAYADSGLTGRKIICDMYGGIGRHGGGAFSGKDVTKIDRCAAYYARYVAKNTVASDIAKKCEVQVGYAIGVAKPVSLNVDAFGKSKYTNEQILEAVTKLFNFTPRAIKNEIITDDISFKSLAEYGHVVEVTFHFLGKEQTGLTSLKPIWKKSMESKQDISIRRFYRSDKWKVARALKIASVGGLCEKCVAIGTEVHRKIHLTLENVGNPEISLNQDNLLLLCNECYNKEHGRFEGKKEYEFDADGNMVKR